VGVVVRRARKERELARGREAKKGQKNLLVRWKDNPESWGNAPRGTGENSVYLL